MNEVSKVKRINRVKPIAKYLSGTATVALSEGNGSQRSTATTHNGGERRNQHNERDGTPTPASASVPMPGMCPM